MAAPYQTPYYATQGVQIYLYNQLISPGTVIAVPASMGLDGLSGDATSIETTNLDSPGFKEYAKGLVDPGSPGGDVVYNFQSAAQQALEEYLTAGQNAVTQWFVGAADGTAAPTIVAGVMVPPHSVGNLYTRSGFAFYGFVKSMTKSIQVNSFIKAKLAIQASGKIEQIVLGKTYTP